MRQHAKCWGESGPSMEDKYVQQIFGFLWHLCTFLCIFCIHVQMKKRSLSSVIYVGNCKISVQNKTL